MVQSQTSSRADQGTVLSDVGPILQRTDDGSNRDARRQTRLLRRRVLSGDSEQLTRNNYLYPFPQIPSPSLKI